MKKTLLLTIPLLLLASCATTNPAPAIYRNAPGALGPYSASVTTGNIIFVAGKIGERGQSFEHEVNTSIDAVEAELIRAGSDLGHILSATVYLTDLDNYAAFNEIYGSRLPSPHPARACVQVSRLPGNARVEIMVIAVKKQ